MKNYRQKYIILKDSDEKILRKDIAYIKKDRQYKRRDDDDDHHKLIFNPVIRFYIIATLHNGKRKVLASYKARLNNLVQICWNRFIAYEKLERWLNLQNDKGSLVFGESGKNSW